MIDAAIFDELEAIFAYDQGATDSGVKNDVRRAEVAALLDGADENEIRVVFGRWLREHYLSDEGLAQGYGPEDAREFAAWIYDGDYRVR